MVGNVIILIMYFFLAALTAYFICKGIFTNKRARLTPYLIFFSFMIFCWQICRILFFAVPRPELALYFYNMNLPFTTLCSLAGLLFIMRFYSKDLYISKTVFGALLVIPIVTLILALAGPGIPLFRNHIEILWLTRLRTVKSTPGVWLWIVIIYNFILISICIGISMVQNRSLSRGYRRPSVLLIAGLWIILLCAAIDTLLPSIDLALCAATLCNAFVAYATRNNLGKEFLVRARKEIYKNLDEAIFITDDEGLIINKNGAVNKILKICGLSLDTVNYGDVYDGMKKKSRKVEIMPDADEGTFFYLFNDPGETVYHVQEKEILDKDKARTGSIITYRDVTENKSLISQLDKEGGVDPLTGLSNRRKNKYFISELDQRQNFPLGVIVGDLDNLKTINDIHGHQMGDLMMRVAAEALNFCCPSNCRISRIGGDEFIILLPNMDIFHIETLAEAIRNHFSTITAYPFAVSMSLGFSVKDGPDQKLSDVIDQAYDRMLENKNSQRVKGELHTADSGG